MQKGGGGGEGTRRSINFGLVIDKIECSCKLIVNASNKFILFRLLSNFKIMNKYMVRYISICHLNFSKTCFLILNLNFRNVLPIYNFVRESDFNF